MTDTTVAKPAAPAAQPPLALRLVVDLGVAALWTALIAAIVLFSGVVTQFAYVDF
jgi:hypothetical protein